MTSKKSTDSPQKRWIGLADDVRSQVPHLNSVLVDEENFIELRIKARDDGTSLAVLKRYGSDGGPLVCFGSGYGVFGALIAIDATINGGNWRVDKPWDGSVK